MSNNLEIGRQEKIKESTGLRLSLELMGYPQDHIDDIVDRAASDKTALDRELAWSQAERPSAYAPARVAKDIVKRSAHTTFVPHPADIRL